MKKFKHIFGADGQFVLLENRNYWLAVNDADWQNAPPIGADVIMHDEAFYPTGSDYPEIELPDNVKIFSEEARLLEQKRLDALALEELARDLKAANAGYDLERLIAKIDFHLTGQDKLFD
ncbi:hypothetical protein [Neisseria perflava]|uniref:hypothetical protein n=1 Tax=Neisseria perflava TaxID=33053 RepID=UPI00209F0439|nr:hypothetical protein [Neisseria perflava]MCP1659581.1 hypothetical protein [Neisseria perflava]MCP1772438.1 hypothetical protein [Neisseria perflava]